MRRTCGSGICTVIPERNQKSQFGSVEGEKLNDPESRSVRSGTVVGSSCVKVVSEPEDLVCIFQARGVKEERKAL
jgi:hypothetical protein